METIEMISIPAIVTIVFAVMQILKKAIANENFDRFVPLCAVLLGAIIGAVAFYVYPSIIPTDHIVSALLIGAASGWAATGVYETGKGLKKE